MSWGEAAWRMLARREELLRSAPSPRGRVGYVEDGTPAAALLDLAIQACGGVPVPLPPGGAARRAAEAAELDVCLHRPGGPPAKGDPAASVGPALRLAKDLERPAWRSAPRPADDVEVAPCGPAATWTGEWLDLSLDELVRKVERLERALAAAGPAPAAGREIVVAPRSLSDPWGRAVGAWSLVRGAAWVVEPDPALRVAAAMWVRPTVFVGDRDDLGELRRRIVEGRRRHRLLLGRLRTVASWDGELAAEERQGWESLGVAPSVV